MIYGYKKSYEECLEESGLPTLFERRLDLIDSFLKKTVNNERYKDWFPTKDFVHHDMRRERIYVEKFAKTERLYMNPLYFFRRRLNEIEI